MLKGYFLSESSERLVTKIKFLLLSQLIVRKVKAGFD